MKQVSWLLDKFSCLHDNPFPTNSGLPWLSLNVEREQARRRRTKKKKKKKKVKKKQKKKVTRPKKARLEKGTQKTVGCGRFEGETVNILHSRKGKFRAEAKMEASEAESVARCALQAYQKLPAQGKPKASNEWTVLSALVLKTQDGKVSTLPAAFAF